MRKRLVSVLLLLLALSFSTDALGSTKPQRRKRGPQTAFSCWSRRDCTGKRIDRRADCHNCKRVGGKSLGDPGNCRKC